MSVANFIITYFITKGLSTITAFVCWSPDEVAHLWRSASRAGVRLRVWSDFRRAPETSPYEFFCEGMLLDVNCPDAEELLEKASSSHAFNHGHSWLLLHNTSHDRTIISDFLANSSILPDADVIWSSPDVLMDVYRVKLDQPYLLTELGLGRNCTTQELNSLWSALPSVVTRRKDLQGIYLSAGVVVSEPQNFRGWSDLRDRQIDTYPKLSYPLIMLTTQDLNYRLNMRQVDLYGAARNGSFTGLAGLLQRGRVELGVASMFMRADRMRFLHYYAETYLLTNPFIFRQPSQSAVSNVFLLPFSGGVWAAGGGAALLAAVLLRAPRHALAHARADPALAQLTLPDCCTFALGTMCQQGFHVTPSVLSVRVVMFSTLLSSLFLFTAYSAKIVALLQTPSDAIRTLDQLTRSPLALGVQNTTYRAVYFVESASPVTQQLYRRKLEPLGERAYYTVVDGIEKMRNGLFAFQVERSSAYDVIQRTYTEREKCGLHELEAFKLPVVALPVRKHSGYRELLAVRMRWMREVGLMDQARRHWMSERPRCEAGGGGFVIVGLTDVLPALQVLGVGAALALLLLFAERLAHTMRNKETAYPPHHGRLLPFRMFR